MHSEFISEFIVQSNHDTSTLEITFISTQNLYCSHHRIKNCPTLEIGVQCIQNLHVNSQYGQIMTTLPQILLFAVHRNIIRYSHFGPMDHHGSVLVKFQAEGKIFEITRTIHSNSDRSEQFLVKFGFSEKRTKFEKNLPYSFDKSADLLSKCQNHKEDFFKLCASQEVRTLKGIFEKLDHP